MRVENLCTYINEVGWLLCVSKESSIMECQAKLLRSLALCDAGQEHGAQGGAARGQCLTACRDIALYCLEHKGFTRALPPEVVSYRPSRPRSSWRDVKLIGPSLLIARVKAFGS